MFWKASSHYNEDDDDAARWLHRTTHTKTMPMFTLLWQQLFLLADTSADDWWSGVSATRRVLLNIFDSCSQIDGIQEIIVTSRLTQYRRAIHVVFAHSVRRSLQRQHTYIDSSECFVAQNLAQCFDLKSFNIIWQARVFNSFWSLIMLVEIAWIYNSTRVAAVINSTSLRLRSERC